MGAQAATAGVPILAGIGIGVATGNPMLGFATAGGVSSVMGGVAGYQASKAEEAQIKLQRKEAQLAGEQRANEIKRQMMSTLGEQTAMLASRGVALGQGSPDTLATETTRRFNEDLRVNRLNMLTEAERSRYAVASSRAGGAASILGGVQGAAMTGYSAYEGWRQTRPMPAQTQRRISPTSISLGPYRRTA